MVEFILTFVMLSEKQIKISGESLVKPAVTPALGCDQISKPLVCQFVRHQVVTGKIEMGPIVMQGHLRQSGCGSVFHTTENEVLGHNLGVLRVGVRDAGFV